MNKVKMLKTTKGMNIQPIVEVFKKDGIYSISDELLAIFIDMEAVEMVEDEDESRELSEEEKIELVIIAIGDLDTEDTSNFTKSGVPHAIILSEKCGFEVSADLRDKAFNSLAKE